MKRSVPTLASLLLLVASFPGAAEAEDRSFPFGLRGELGYQAFSHDDDALRHLLGRLNAGIGIRWRPGGLNTFVEARFHHVFDDQHAQPFVPLPIGVLF